MDTVVFGGLEKFRFCIILSQYGEREGFLLKNLCFALGAKFTEKAFKGVSHLICKFASGQKYVVYSKRGTRTITAEWLYECVKQDTIVPFELLCGCQEVTTSNPTRNSGVASANEETIAPAVSKRTLLSVSSKANDTCRNMGRTERHLESGAVPDVADVIEVLSSKIQDVQSPRTIFEPDNSAVVQDQKDAHSFGISRSWLNMQPKQDNTPGSKVQSLNSSPAPSPAPTTYYSFSETQTESQVVGYEEGKRSSTEFAHRALM